MAHQGGHAPHVGDTIIAGALSGMFSATMTYPFGMFQGLHFEIEAHEARALAESPFGSSFLLPY